jgi:hypothetical protein
VNENDAVPGRLRNPHPRAREGVSARMARPHTSSGLALCGSVPRRGTRYANTRVDFKAYDAPFPHSPRKKRRAPNTSGGLAAMPLRKAEAGSVPGRGERPTTGQPGLSRVVQLDCRNACWVRFRSSSKRPSVASRALIPAVAHNNWLHLEAKSARISTVGFCGAPP